MRLILSLAITAAFAAAACTSSAAPASNDESAAESTLQPAPDTTGDEAASPLVPVEEGVYRVAGAGEQLPDLLAWDHNEIRKQTPDGALLPMPSGPFFNVVDVPHLGVVFQRNDVDQTVWLAKDVGERDLLVTDGEMTLELEGAGVNAEDQAQIFYQRRVPGSPEDTVTTLRSYNVETKEVATLGTTGGWESGTSFNHLSGSVAIARWGAEGWTGLALYDLGANSDWGKQVGVECFDGEDGCIWYDGAVIFSGDGYGIGPDAAGDGDTVDAYALYRFDLESGDREIVMSWPWDNGKWNVEEMFAHGGKLVVSLMDGDGEPLPALIYDVTAATAWTLPQSGFVRPAYSS